MADALYRQRVSAQVRFPLAALTTDKELVKHYVTSVVGERYVVPTISILRESAEVEQFQFPETCVIKPTHLSGEVILRNDGSRVDIRRLYLWLNQNYYTWTREPTYRDLEPKVIVEPYVFGRRDPPDYKIFCVRGRPGLIWVDEDRSNVHRRSMYTPNWEFLPFLFGWVRGGQWKPQQGRELPAPDNFDEMLRIACRLSEPFDLVRVDLYSNGSEIRLGEMTHSTDFRASASTDEGAVRIMELLFGPED